MSDSKSKSDLSRRRFMQAAAIIGATPFMGKRSSAMAENMTAEKIEGTVPNKALGKTGVEVSALGLGGYHLGSANTDQVANEIVASAVDHGINFFDNAWEYHDGLSEER